MDNEHESVTRQRREDLFTSLFGGFVRNRVQVDRQQLILKWIFFFIVCFVFLFVVVFGALGIWNIATRTYITWSDVGAAFAGFASIVSVIIVLPNKIAEYLFPKSAEKSSVEFLKAMQEYDIAKRIRDSGEKPHVIVDL